MMKVQAWDWRSVRESLNVTEGKSGSRAPRAKARLFLLPSLHSDRLHGHVRNDQILVVEDDRSLARLDQLNLEAEGYDVTICHEGRQAIADLQTNVPDLVLLDSGSRHQ